MERATFVDLGYSVVIADEPARTVHPHKCVNLRTVIRGAEERMAATKVRELLILPV